MVTHTQSKIPGLPFVGMRTLYRNWGTRHWHTTSMPMPRGYQVVGRLSSTLSLSLPNRVSPLSQQVCYAKPFHPAGDGYQDGEAIIMSGQTHAVPPKSPVITRDISPTKWVSPIVTCMWSPGCYGYCSVPTTCACLGRKEEVYTHITSNQPEIWTYLAYFREGEGGGNVEIRTIRFSSRN